MGFWASHRNWRWYPRKRLISASQQCLIVAGTWTNGRLTSKFLALWSVSLWRLVENAMKRPNNCWSFQYQLVCWRQYPRTRSQRKTNQLLSYRWVLTFCHCWGDSVASRGRVSFQSWQRLISSLTIPNWFALNMAHSWYIYFSQQVELDYSIATENPLLSEAEINDG